MPQAAPVTFAWDLDPTHDGATWDVEIDGQAHGWARCAVTVTPTERRCTASVPASAQRFRLFTYAAQGALFSVVITRDGPLPGSRPGAFALRWHRFTESGPEPNPVAWSLLFHDGFSGSEYTSISGRTPDTLGTSWVQENPTLRLGTGGAALGQVGAGRASISDSIGNDQAVELDILTRSSYTGIMARYQTATDSGDYNFQCYFVTWEASGVTLWKLAGGSNNLLHWTSLGTASPSFSSPDTLRLEAVGNQLTVLVNGSIVIGPVSDSTYASGKVGIFSDTGGDNFADNFKAYQDAGGGSSILRTMMQLHH
jgi:hypothetical protein